MFSQHTHTAHTHTNTRSRNTGYLVSCLCGHVCDQSWPFGFLGACCRGSFNYGNTAGRRSIHLLPPSGQNRQTLWMLSGIAANFYETNSAKRGKAALRKAYEIVCESHRKLWPGVVVPQIQQAATESGDNSSDSCMPTSLMVAYLVHMISMSKRKPVFRHRAYELLKVIIERLAVHRPTLDFLMCNVHGQGEWVRQTLSSAHSCTPWSLEFFQHHLHMTWLSDLANKDIPWVTSYPTDGQIHLADWLAFSLDFPAWVMKRANSEILWAKQVSERSALSVLTQLALHIEGMIEQITTKLAVTKKTLQKLPKPLKWGYVASAMDMVFASQDPKKNSSFHILWFQVLFAMSP